eukprot:m.9248 g.9248  ORF g.9248 m.9248 type:complete len:127 (-) comp6312_c0_seq1:1521-1901(-)
MNFLRHAVHRATSLASVRCGAASVPRQSGSIGTLWKRSMSISPEVEKTIEEMVNNNKLFVFMKGTPEAPMCGFSRVVVTIFDAHGIDPLDLKSFNVLSDQDIREGIKEYSEWPTIPQVYVNGVCGW